MTVSNVSAAGAPAELKDPFALVAPEVVAVMRRVLESVSTSVPRLGTAASHLLRGQSGKMLRPSLMLLMGTALTGTAPVLEVDHSPSAEKPACMRRSIQRIAEVAEIFHVASLLHDDVIDNSSSRRDMAAVHMLVGPKVAILGGDFLLARASVIIASFGLPRLLVLTAAVLEDLVKGELMQATRDPAQLTSMGHYLEKTYCKTASLMANFLEAVAAVAAPGDDGAVAAARAYGSHLGLAFQVVDDLLDITSDTATLGKPACSDMRNGIPTAPVLYAAEEAPELVKLVGRRFKYLGDVRRATRLLHTTHGLERARVLAEEHAAAAVAAVRALPPPPNKLAAEAREALIAITRMVLQRKK